MIGLCGASRTRLFHDQAFRVTSTVRAQADPRHTMLSFSISLLWVPATLIAASAQTLRNATQRSLTEAIGVVGATQVRFVFGFPFALLFLALAAMLAGSWPPAINQAAFLWSLGGAATQIVATGLMLATMKQRSFAVTTAYTKTEPVQVAIFAAIVLGDPLGLLKFAAVLVATVGVLMISFRKGESVLGAGLKPLMFGILAGAFFALAAVCFRGAILALDSGVFFLRASTILVWGLGLQSLMLILFLGIMDRVALTSSFRVWRQSLFAGFLGALASQFWFIGFSLTAVANVRTLALVEVFLAQAMSRKLFAETISRREIIGMALIALGVGVILMQAI
jgi:drug/metabolite transporter (DMT)-like permease